VKAIITRKVPHVIYGGDYNPEQWSEEVWCEDVRLMREAGVNLVSLGIFSWAKLEPQPGEYDFGWLDRIIALLHENGVMVDLATATASPPPWLARLYPESLPVTREGTTLHPGARQHYCPSSPAYREKAAELVRRIADRYETHPALALWHVNNEYSVHLQACSCDVSAAHFREWLKARYGDLDALNEAWGTAFWSQRYGEWGEIMPPRTAPTFPNPIQQLDYHRFFSDALLECFTMERDILKEITPEVPITTNFLGFPKALDLWRWSRELDVSLDLYSDRPERRYARLLLQTVCRQAGVLPTLEAPPGVDAVRRNTGDASFLFLLNHNENAVEVGLPEPARDLLTDTEHDSTLMLGPFEVAILQGTSRSGPPHNTDSEVPA